MTLGLYRLSALRAGSEKYNRGSKILGQKKMVFFLTPNFFSVKFRGHQVQKSLLALYMFLMVHNETFSSLGSVMYWALSSMFEVYCCCPLVYSCCVLWSPLCLITINTRNNIERAAPRNVATRMTCWVVVAAEKQIRMSVEYRPLQFTVIFKNRATLYTLNKGCVLHSSPL